MTFNILEIAGTASHAAPDNDAALYQGPAFPNLDAEIAEAAGTIFSDVPVNRIHAESGSVAVRLLRNWVADLRDPVFNADLSDDREFGAIMNLVIGLGLSQRELARHLGVDDNTVSRYCKGRSTPSSVPSRRGTVVETFRFLQGKVLDGDLPTLKLFEPQTAARA